MKEKKEPSRPPIHIKTKIQLWSRVAGRCQFEGCNRLLNTDTLQKTDNNAAYIAHIYGYAPNSARYDRELSPKLETDLSNLMLLCDECHRRIDDLVEWVKYPADLLLRMKREHEERIELVSSIDSNKKTNVILLGAKIGEHKISLGYDDVKEFVIPKFYPSGRYPIELGFYNNPQEDNDSIYWQTQRDIIRKNYNEKVLPLLAETPHISIFALAPIPLLIKVGVLLGDKIDVEIHQPIRNPRTWNLSNERADSTFSYIVQRPSTRKAKRVALNISLSAHINEDRIYDILGEDCDIYSLTIKNPFNDYLRDKNQLEVFSENIRMLLDEIKLQYKQNTPLHLFPAMPVATAIELGRCWMPKADMPLVVYDQNNKAGKFIETIKIGEYAN